MEEALIKKINDLRLTYVKIDNQHSLTNIYNLFVNNEFNEPTSSMEYLYYGLYYDKISHDYVQMKNYYLKAIGQNNACAMHNLGMYYKTIEENYEMMKKYFFMAINQGVSSSINQAVSFCMNSLALYYENIEKNYELMKKYYLMAIEFGHSSAMYELGDYYQTIKNYELMKKYYLMAIELGHSSAMDNLGWHYRFTEKNYELMKKYYLMAIECKDSDALDYLINYYNYENLDYKELKYCMLNNEKYKNRIQELLKKESVLLQLSKSFIKHQTLKNRIKEQKLIILHLKYKPDGEKYLSIKNHFQSLVLTN